MFTVRLLRARLQLLLLRFEKLLERLLGLFSALVLVAAQTDNGWALTFGRWGALVTLLVYVAAGEIRKARGADAKP